MIRFGFVITIITVAIPTALLLLESVSAQSGEGGGNTGDVVNSKYLTITDHRYRTGDFSDQITGTIANNSTQEVSSPSVYAVLYDENNQLITVESGYADVSPLPPADDSAFSISLFLPEEDDVDHYTLYAGGRPS
jgi:hypothetical protein